MSDWGEWGKHVLAELKRNDQNIEKLDEKIDLMVQKLVLLEREVAVFKTKIGAIGTVASMIVIGLVELFRMFKE